MSAKKPKRPRTVQPTQPRTAPAVRRSASPQLWLLFAGLVLLTLAVYYPAWHGGLLWDDDAHITRVDLRSLSGLWRIWFDVGATQQYYPAAHSAFWVFYQIWGDNTLGYHLVNIVLHASSAFLVAVILRRLAIPGAALAAMIFAVHPVGVESVAWITELKNTLSGVCYLGAALMYLRFDESRERRWYALSAGLFVLALFSKTVTATLPAALLVIFWWQRGQIRWREDVVPLLPMFVIGVFSGLLTAWVERAQIGADGPAFAFTFIERCLIAGRAFWFYLGKLVWPTDLMFIYPRWQVSQQVAWQYAYPLALVALLAGLWWYRRRSRAPLAAVLFFAGTLFPALGFVNVYPFIYSFVADHFQYLASLGIIVLISAGVATLARQWQTAVSVAIVVPLALLATNQSRQYADAETLYRTTLARNPSCWMAYVNLGKLRQEQARAQADDPRLLEEAATDFREALRLEPSISQPYNNLGTVVSKGFELGVDRELTDIFSGFMNYTFQADPIPSFPGFTEEQALKEINIPSKHQFNAGVSWITNRVYGTFSVTHASEAFWQDVLDARYSGTTPPYTSVNMTAGVKFQDGRYSLALKITNLGNQQIQQHIFGDILKRSVVGEFKVRLK